MKKKTITLLLLLFAVLAIAAGVMTKNYLSPQKTTVYMFNGDYEAGTQLSENMLTPVQCDAGIVVAGKNTSASECFVTGDNIVSVISSGEYLRIDVSDGMPLTFSMLSLYGGSDIEMMMDPNKVAVSIPVNAISGVTNDLKVGSRVNIYATGINTDGITLTLQAMKVLSVVNDANGNICGVTIEADVNESLKLVYAANYTTIYLGLVDASGYEYSSGEPTFIPKSGN